MTMRMTTNHHMEDFAGLERSALAVVFGNLLSLVICLVVYANYVIFHSYGLELIYAVLLSEALFSMRQKIIRYVRSWTVDVWSPKEFIRTANGRMFIFVVYFLPLSYVFGVANVIIPLLVAVCAVYVLDVHALFIFRLHRVVISDETFVSLVIVIVLVVFLSIFFGSFSILALSDANSALDAAALYVEVVLKDPHLSKRFSEALKDSRSLVDDLYAKVIGSKGGEANSIWGPAVNLTATILANLSRNLDADAFNISSTASISGVFLNWTAWSEVWKSEMWGPLTNELLSAGTAAISNATISQKALTNFFDGFSLTLQIIFRIGFGFIDIGVRAAVFIGALFFLISNEKSVLQTILEAVLQVFSRASKTIRRPSFEFSASPSHHRMKRNSTDTVNRSISPPLGKWENRIQKPSSGSENHQAGIASTLSSQFIPEPKKFDDESHDDEYFAERAKSFKHFEHELRATFVAVFALPVTLAFCNAISTLVLFTSFNVFLGANLFAIFFASAVSLFLSLIPIVHPFLSCIPWCIVASVVHDKPSIAVMLFIAQYSCFSFIDDFVVTRMHRVQRKENSQLRAYLTSLSFFFGISSFGVNGIILGPLLVSIFYTLVSTVLFSTSNVYARSDRN